MKYTKILLCVLVLCVASAKGLHNSLNLILVGDALLHKSVYEDAYIPKKLRYGSARYDFSTMLELIAPITKKYDLAFYNQETILGGTELGLSTYPRFNSPKEFGINMLNIGFNLISLANNHTLDKGEKGVRSMLRFWRKREAKHKEIYTTGSFESIRARNKIQHKILQKNGISYAMLAYTYGTNGIPLPKGKEYLVNIYTKEMLQSDIESIRKEVDLLIVSIHWGVEYTHKPTKEQRDIAKFLADLGVDIVIGNHPHAIQPIERIGDTLVFYALGNFISGQVGLQKRVGMIASVRISKSGIKNDSKRVKWSDVRADLIYTYYSQESQKMSGFKIYPFSLLSKKLLPRHESIYNNYLTIIKKDWITIGL